MNKYWVPAKELKKQFIVKGSFYNLKISDSKKIKCRNLLEIYDEKMFGNRNSNTKPDAIVIMMNPGSSEPESKKFSIPEFETNNLSKNLLKNPLVPTKPDRTQYQVMRIMKAKKWAYVRVLNLSDFRCPSSEDFSSKLSEIQQMCGDLHSIFSNLRSDERCLLLADAENYILAWGLYQWLEPMAYTAARLLLTQSVVGIESPINGVLFYHPRQFGLDGLNWWLNSIMEQLNLLEAN